MRLTALTLISALVLPAAAVSALAAPLVPSRDPHQAPGIVQVSGGCGPVAHPVPGHWDRRRGGWIAPHCAPNVAVYAHPYWGWHRRYW